MPAAAARLQLLPSHTTVCICWHPAVQRIGPSPTFNPHLAGHLSLTPHTPGNAPHRPPACPAVQCIGPSMMPTFNPRGDVTLVEHVSVWTRNIQIGDVVLARSAQVGSWADVVALF